MLELLIGFDGRGTQILCLTFLLFPDFGLAALLYRRSQIESLTNKTMKPEAFLNSQPKAYIQK
jgi:hypothetical protein